VARILYSKNAKVYIFARTKAKAQQAITDIKNAHPNSKGELIYIHLDLTDLVSVKESAQEFLRRESRLDILFNNAGLGYPGKLSHTKQGYELQLGTNCVGPFALTHHLTPLLVDTAKKSTRGAVRVVWVSSGAAFGPPPAKFIESLDRVETMGAIEMYGTSKLGNFLHAAEFASRHEKDCIISVSLNPGNLHSEFLRNQEGTLLTWLLRKTVLHPTVMGAYTILFAGLSPDVTQDKSGSFSKSHRDNNVTGVSNYRTVAPFGRLLPYPQPMVDAGKPVEGGGSGIARRFWDWSETQIRPYI
jgi:retinol dehydrogenase 12